MMYQNKFVVAVKVGGKILRESGDSVAIPFGSEYTILVKNLHTVRAKFRISIDGESTDHAWFVAGPYASVEIERFSKDGDLTRGRRFKFIERTNDIENHRGIKADDGLIRVEYQIEQVPVFSPISITGNWPNAIPNTPYNFGTYCNSSGVTGSSVRSRSLQALGSLTLTKSSTQGGDDFAFASEHGQNMATNQIANAQQAVNEIGITVAGSESTQRFVTVNDFPSGPSEAIVIHLRGRINDVPVTVARTVIRSRVCASCGKKSAGSAEFCWKCGTSLVN